MTQAPRRRDPRVVAGQYLGAAALTLLAFLWGFTVLAFGWPDTLGLGPVMQDFHAFHITGGMVREGTAAGAYAEDTLRPVQAAATGTDKFMPWTYPPHFNLVAAALALLPLWAGYALFAGGGLIAYALVLRALAGRWSGTVLGAMFPMLAICVGTGQNGLWVGAVAGLLAMVPGRLAGVPLALLTLKPHFLPGVGLLWLLRREGAAILTAAALVAGLLVLATLVQGAGIWTAFLGGMTEAGDFLAAGAYRFARMASVYAAAHAAGLPATAALALQGM
ncbi:MAG TPA: glycosyltransferase family 87 protein, partial [Paracoccaceae bacterium]|nr:glycosyltransferase family 87 protein [Paracoccaceae bacterium]